MSLLTVCNPNLIVSPSLSCPPPYRVSHLPFPFPSSYAVLAAELLKEAEQLVEKNIHPQTIISGWRKAVTCARAALEASAKNHG